MSDALADSFANGDNAEYVEALELAQGAWKKVRSFNINTLLLYFAFLTTVEFFRSGPYAAYLLLPVLALAWCASIIPWVRLDDLDRARLRLLDAAKRLLGPGATVEIVHDDVTARAFDVIVHDWNRNFLPASLVWPKRTPAIMRAVGFRGRLELFGSGPIWPGSAIDSRPGTLSCKRVIHVASSYAFGITTSKCVRRAARESLVLAAMLGYRTVAMPLLGVGPLGMPPAGAEAAILDAVEELRDLPLDVTILRPSAGV